MTENSIAAPANTAVEYLEELKPFNGAFNYTSLYRGTPNREMDAAWIKISTGGIFDFLNRASSLYLTANYLKVPTTRITKEQLTILGEPDTPSKVKYRPEDGGGYMAALEVTHQLHCLVSTSISEQTTMLMAS